MNARETEEDGFVTLTGAMLSGGASDKVHSLTMHGPAQCVRLQLDVTVPLADALRMLAVIADWEDESDRDKN